MAQNSTTPVQNGISTYAEGTATGTSADDPIEITEGENTVPAAAGKYYFIFHPTKTGYLNITSENALTDGQVKIFGNKIHAQTENAYGLKGSSTVGSYAVRMEVPYAVASTNYYIVIDKKTATDNADTFTLKMEDYQPGQTEATALTLTGESEQLTLKEAKGTYYYSLEVPANTNKNIIVKGPETLSTASSVTWYVKGASSYGNPTMNKGVLKTDLINEKATTYILKIVSAEETPMTLSVSYEDVQEGSLIKLPKTATFGQNTIDIDAETEYFSYTATMDGKLTVDVKNDKAEVSFPMGTGKYDGCYDAIAVDNAYSIQVSKGETYLIEITGLKKNDTFTIAESEFQPGESIETAIAIDGNSYTFGENVSSLWLKYTVATDGVIEISCDAPYQGKGSINVSKNREEAQEILENGVYKGKVFVNAGDELYIYVLMEGQDINGKTLTFTSRDFLPGENYTAPIVLEKDKSTDVSTGTWVKCSLPKGESTLYVVNYASFTLFKSLYAAQMDEGSYVPTEDEELPNGDFVSKFKVSMEEAGDIYIKITYTEGEAKLVYADPTTGISDIEAAQQDGKVVIYNLNGMKVNQISGNGVYIIKSNGQTKKIVVKK